MAGTLAKLHVNLLELGPSQHAKRIQHTDDSRVDGKRKS
jgi:hypothetical protein